MNWTSAQFGRAFLRYATLGLLIAVAVLDTAIASDLADAIGKAAGENYTQRFSEPLGELVSREARQGYRFQRTFSHARARMSIRVGGVLLGAPAQGKMKLDPKGFKYELLPSANGQPRRVGMSFQTASGEAWSLEAPAATVTIMSLLAADARAVALTLSEDEDVGLRVSRFQSVVVHPAVEKTRLVFHFGWVDTLADSRLSDGMQSVTEAIRERLLLYETLADLCAMPDAKVDLEDIDDELATIRELDEAWQDSTPIFFGRPGDLPPVEQTEGAIVGLMARSCRSASFAEIVERHIGDDTSAAKLVELVRADFRAGKYPGLEVAVAADLLSMVQERPWKLTPQDLTPPKVSPKPRREEFLFDIKHRLVFDDDQLLEWHKRDGEKAFQDRYAELGLSKQLWEGIADRITPAELTLLQELNEAIVVYRIVRAACDDVLTDFPQEGWVQLLADVKEIHRANEQVSTVKMFQAASVWNTFERNLHVLRLRLGSPDLAPVMPAQLPDRIRLK